VRGLQERRPVTALTGEAEVASRQVTTGTGTRRLAVAVVVVAAVVAADQLTKWWAVTRLTDGPVHVVGTLDFELALNRGSAFSLFQGQSFFLVLVAAVLIAGLLVLVWRSPTTGRAAVIGLILGGALGNLADRLFRSDHGAVVDFIALHFWPTFNVADASIVVGCGLLLISLVRSPRQP
jgi:signal peptidase II